MDMASALHPSLVTEDRRSAETAGTVHIRDCRPKNEQVVLTGVGLRIPENLAFEDWEQAGRRLSGIVDSSAWWLGDWLVFGKRNYSDRYQRAIRAVGLQYQTLRNYAWVARRFDFDRRRSLLTFQHHAEVASLSAEVQERLLDRAEQSTWSTKQLRKAIRELRMREAAEEPGGGATNARIEVPNSRLSLWRRAADHQGLEFDRWVWAMLDRAAEDVLNDELEMRSA